MSWRPAAPSRADRARARAPADPTAPARNSLRVYCMFFPPPQCGNVPLLDRTPARSSEVTRNPVAVRGAVAGGNGVTGESGDPGGNGREDPRPSPLPESDPKMLPRLRGSLSGSGETTPEAQTRLTSLLGVRTSAGPLPTHPECFLTLRDGRPWTAPIFLTVEILVRTLFVSPHISSRYCHEGYPRRHW